MSYNFTIDNVMDFMTLDELKTFDLTFPNNVGFVKSYKEKLNANVSLFKVDFFAKEELNAQMLSKIEGGGLFLGLCLDGKAKYKDNVEKNSHFLEKGFTFMKYAFDEYDSTTVMPKNGFSKSLGMVIKDKFLEENKLKDILLKKTNTFNPFIKKTNTKNIKLINELYNSPFNGELHTLYIQSKVLEIIYNEFEEMNQSNVCCNLNCACSMVKLSAQDIEALHKAKEIILFSNDFPDLSSLARKVSLNEFKLKYGFKKLFNQSPGNMILEQKMFYAKQLLEISDYSIKEISDIVGYKYQQSFTNAFFQFFKILPKDLIKTRRHYFFR